MKTKLLSRIDNSIEVSAAHEYFLHKTYHRNIKYVTELGLVKIYKNSLHHIRRFS